MDEAVRSRTRALLPVAAAALLLGVIALAMVSRERAFPTAATSPAVLLAMLAGSGVVLAASRGLGPGWFTLRRCLVGLAAVAVAYPGIWGAAALTTTAAPGSAAAWFTAVLAGTAHLPVLASFSLVPLLAVTYLGGGLARWPIIAVGGLAALATTCFALFFSDFAPFEADALVEWAPGEAIGLGANLVFLASVLVGPVVALVGAWRADTEAARRLALVGASSLGGAALVMLCGAAVLVGGAADAVVLVGMYAALAVVCAGTVHALSTPLPKSAVEGRGDVVVDATAEQPSPTPGGAGRSGSVTPQPLTPREAEVLSLLASGLSNAGIAARLVLSERTVDAHLRSVFTKLDLPDGPQQNRRVHAARRWAEASEQALHPG
jgi:DNA-binding CsgD family transcriptional regulator